MQRADKTPVLWLTLNVSMLDEMLRLVMAPNNHYNGSAYFEGVIHLIEVAFTFLPCAMGSGNARQ